MLKYAGGALVAGYIADLIMGDPRWLYHPVRLMGNFIAWLEKIIRKVMPGGAKAELTGGALMVAATLIIWGAVSWALLYCFFKWNFAAGMILECFMCYQMIAVKSLKDESMKVYGALKHGTLEEGQKAVSRIVGRDVQSLDETGVAKAAVETVAENFSDGVIAPMFYMILGGPVLMYIYKAINTMDSMVGYKHEKYLFFGRWAARLDDIVNFIPSRISALLLIGASYVGGYDGAGAFRIFKRDRFNHASPNSAQTEAAAAGALGIQLAGDAYYFGKLYEKPTIGDDMREVSAKDIKSVNRLMYIGSFLAVMIFALVHLGITIIVY